MIILKNVYDKMAFSFGGPKYQKQKELSFYLSILLQYPSGQISKPEMIESLRYMEQRYKLDELTKGFYSLFEIEDEVERLERFEICLNRLIGELKRFRPREYLEAIRD